MSANSVIAMPSHYDWETELHTKLTIVAVDDFALRSTAPDADPATMLVLATATQQWLNSQPIIMQRCAEMLVNDVLYGHPSPFEETP